MNTHLFRLHPNTSLRESIEAFCSNKTPNGAAMITCVGSLTTARLRMVGGNAIIEKKGPFEIVSLVGTWTPHGGHWHISLSDGDGNLWGGHLCTGSIVYTTAEIVIADIGVHHPIRQYDPQTGYDELFVPHQE